MRLSQNMWHTHYLWLPPTCGRNCILFVEPTGLTCGSPALGTLPHLCQEFHFVRQAALRAPDEQSRILDTSFRWGSPLACGSAPPVAEITFCSFRAKGARRTKRDFCHKVSGGHSPPQDRPAGPWRSALSPTCVKNSTLFVKRRCARPTNKVEFLTQVSGGVLPSLVALPQVLGASPSARGGHASR